MLIQASPSRRARASSRIGSATVEFAVVAPVLVALLLGMIEVTRAIQVKNYLTDTARSGCRLATQPGITSQNVEDNIHSILTNNGIASTNVTVTIKVNDQNIDVSKAARYDEIAVTIAVPIANVSWVTPLFLGKTDVTSEKLVMMHQ